MKDRHRYDWIKRQQPNQLLGARATRMKIRYLGVIMIGMSLLTGCGSNIESVFFVPKQSEGWTTFTDRDHPLTSKFIREYRSQHDSVVAYPVLLESRRLSSTFLHIPLPKSEHWFQRRFGRLTVEISPERKVGDGWTWLWRCQKSDVSVHQGARILSPENVTTTDYSTNKTFVTAESYGYGRTSMCRYDFSVELKSLDGFSLHFEKVGITVPILNYGIDTVRWYQDEPIFHIPFI